MQRMKKSEGYGLRYLSGILGLMTALVVMPSLLQAAPLSLEQRLDMMEKRLKAEAEIRKMLMQQVETMRGEIAELKSNPVASTVEPMELKEWVAKVERKGAWETDFLEGTPDKFFGGQVWFKGGYLRMDHPRRNSLLTEQEQENDTHGWQVGGGVDVPLGKLWGNTLLGEIYLEYVQTQETKGTLPGIADGEGIENVLTVGVAPKYRFDSLDFISPNLASTRAWVIPAGLTFNVNTPVSRAVTNISPGLVSGVGIEQQLWDKRISLGADFRFYWGPDIPDEDLDRMVTGGYLGFNF